MMPRSRPDSQQHNDTHHVHDHTHPDGGHRHGHSHGHQHAHEHHEIGKARLKLVLSITAVFMVVELIGGLLANSLALIADSAHMLTDVAALGLSLFVLWFSRRPATDVKTYGYLRLEILAALLNGSVLIVISGGIFWHAWQRLRAPVDVEAPLMLAVAAAGLLVNVVAALLLHGSAEHNLNVRGAYLHVLGDLLGSVGAMTAALIILTTGWTPADAITSALVGLLILTSSWKLVREAVDVLLEAVPAHIDMGLLRRTITEIPGVDEVHDLHVWSLTSGFLAMSGHVIVRTPEQNTVVLGQIHQRMQEQFGITHVTVQIEPPRLHRLG